MALSTNLVYYYKLDDGSGSTATDSEGSNDGTISGASWVGSGKLGGDSLSFSATSDDVSFGSAFFPDWYDGTWSMSVWVKIDSTGNYHTIMEEAPSGGGGSPQGRFLIWNDNKIAVRYDDGANITLVKGGSTLSSGTWYHIVLVNDGNINTSLNIYLDGSAETLTYSSSNANTNFTVGITTLSRNSTAAQQMQGDIDEVGVWTKALTSTEASDLYNSGSGLAYPFGTAFTADLAESLSVSDSVVAATGINYTASLAEGISFSEAINIITPAQRIARIDTTKTKGTAEIATRDPSRDDKINTWNYTSSVSKYSKTGL